MRKELINKLNKKDKEELLFRIKKEEKNSWKGIGFHYINIFLKYIILLSIVIPLWFIAFENEHINLLIAGINLFMVLGKLIMYAIIIGLLVDYILFFISRIKIIRIKKEYFDIIPKRK